jgi:hypothetical protein
VLPSVWMAALLGAVSTWIQLYLRFSERRPFEAWKTGTFFIFIGVFAGGVSGALALVPLLPVGGEVAGATVGLGTSVPFSQPPGGSLRTRNTKTATEITKVLNSLWAIASLMSNRLSGMLSAAKTRRVDDVVREINALSQSDPYPPFERANSALGWLVDNRTGKDRDVYKGRLASVYQECKNDPDPLTRLISLAYDMNQEGLILDQARLNARPDTGTDPS